MELLFDPLVNTDLCDPVDVAGTNSKCQAIDRVDGAFVLVHAE